MKTTNKYGEKIDLALDTWVKLARAFSTFNKKSIENIRSFNLTQSQFSVLEVLGHLGSMKIGDVCNKMLVSGGNMTLILDNLEKINLIERVFSKEDRRAINVRLTEKGNNLFNEIFKQHAEFIGKRMSVLTKDEQKKLGALLKKLGKGINGD
ncbi:MarR family winged helix-turn-helix transcriptional regulator [Bacteroidota bacterium]